MSVTSANSRPSWMYWAAQNPCSAGHQCQVDWQSIRDLNSPPPWFRFNLEMRIRRYSVYTAVFCAVFLSLGVLGTEASNSLLPHNDFCRTSSFGSWRFGHLHAGIDLSTGGVEGAPVAAIDSCWVWRVSVRNEGYGRAIYIRLPDGKIAVYGHLSAFAPEIEAMVEREQDLRGKYEVDIYNEPFAVTFKKGETIAYSGGSGWGPPHLHFELRSGMYEHFKISPFPDYVDCVDINAPLIHALRVMPVGHGSSIDGDFVGTTITDIADLDTLYIEGDFGVMVSATDYTGCGRTTSPVIYEARVDSETVWSLNLNKFPFSKRGFVWSIYDFDKSGRKYVRLFNPCNLDFNGFDVAHADTGYGGFAPGLHELTVTVADACGNVTTARVPFKYGEFPRFEKVRAERDSLAAHKGAVRVQVEVSPVDAVVEYAYSVAGGPWSEPGGVRLPGGKSGGMANAGRADGGKHEFTLPVGEGDIDIRLRVRNDLGFAREGLFRLPAPGGAVEEPGLDLEITGKGMAISASSATPPSELPVASVFEGIKMSKVPLQPVGRGLYRGYYVPGGGGDAIQARVVFAYGNEKATALAGAPVVRLERASSAVLLTESFRLRLDVPRDMRPNVLLGYEEGEPSFYEGYTDSLGSLTFEPAGTYFVERARVCLALREGSMNVKQGVFADRGETASFRARADSSGMACFKTDFLEKLVVLEDRIPPEITGFKGMGRREDGKYTFTARARDRGSGIDSGTISAFVDGEAAIAGYDPDTGIIMGRTTKPLRDGEHRFTLEVRDNMGNRTSTENTISLR